MIFTGIGIVLRCLSEAAWRSKESLQGVCNVLTVVYVILCVIGLIETFLGRYERPPWATVTMLVFQIAISLYFGFVTDSFVVKIISGIVAMCIVGGVVGTVSSSDGKGDADIDKGFAAWDNFCEENMRRIKEDQIAEEKRRKDEKNSRETYVRDNWNSSRGRLNSNATMYETPEGKWNKISEDGKQYEDDDGYWHKL